MPLLGVMTAGPEGFYEITEHMSGGRSLIFSMYFSFNSLIIFYSLLKSHKTSEEYELPQVEK